MTEFEVFFGDDDAIKRAKEELIEAGVTQEQLDQITFTAKIVDANIGSTDDTATYYLVSLEGEIAEEVVAMWCKHQGIEPGHQTSKMSARELAFHIQEELSVDNEAVIQYLKELVIEIKRSDLGRDYADRLSTDISHFIEEPTGNDDWEEALQEEMNIVLFFFPEED